MGMLKTKKEMIFPKIGGKSFKGKRTVIYFYPKDDTPGCTTEAIEFTQLLTRFKSLGVGVYGVSADTASSHEKFCKKYDLGVPLLSASVDEIKNLGILSDSGKSAKRTTFILDKKGNIEKKYENVKAKGHAEAVLDYLQKRS